MLVGATPPLALRNCLVSVVVSVFVVVVVVVVVVAVVVFVVVIVLVVVVPVVVFFVELQSEIPRPCRTKRNLGEGALGSPQARSLGPAEPKRNSRARVLGPSQVSGSRLDAQQAKSLGPAERKGPPEPDTSSLVRFQAPGWRPTGEIPRPCRGKTSSRWRFLGPAERKRTLARAP